MKKYLVFTIREFLGLSNDYEEIMSSQAEILNKLENIDKMSLQNQEMILKSDENSYSDYLNLKNVIIVLSIIALIGGGFAAINFISGSTDSINSAVNELNQNTKGLAGVVKEAQGISFKNLGPLFEGINTNLADLSTKQLQELNDIKHMTQIIRAVVKPIEAGNQKVFANVKPSDIVFGTYSDDE